MKTKLDTVSTTAVIGKKVVTDMKFNWIVLIWDSMTAVIGFRHFGLSRLIAACLVVIIIVLILFQCQMDGGTFVLCHLGLDVTVGPLGVTVVKLADEDEMRRVHLVFVRYQPEATVGEVVSSVHLHLPRDLVSLIVLVDSRHNCFEEDPRLEELEPSSADEGDGQQMVLSHDTGLPVDQASQNMTGLHRRRATDFLVFVMFVVAIIMTVTD